MNNTKSRIFLRLWPPSINYFSVRTSTSFFMILHCFLVFLICHISEGYFRGKASIVPLRSTLFAESSPKANKVYETKAWESGKIFTKNNSGNSGGGGGGRRSGKKDPWWMRDEEENNPKILPKYKPSWLEGGKLVNSSWKVADLKAEAASRGLSTSGKKDELIERINAASLSASKIDYLSDEHFAAPVYVEPKNGSSRPSCYPEVYETPSEVKRLKESANQLPPPQK